MFCSYALDNTIAGVFLTCCGFSALPFLFCQWAKFKSHSMFSFVLIGASLWRRGFPALNFWASVSLFFHSRACECIAKTSFMACYCNMIVLLNFWASVSLFFHSRACECIAKTSFMACYCNMIVLHFTSEEKNFSHTWVAGCCWEGGH
jgi:hypothetical protein